MHEFRSTILRENKSRSLKRKLRVKGKTSSNFMGVTRL